MIALKEVTKSFGAGPPAVNRVSFTVKSGETLVLLGSSGCGKSTTLKMINGLITPESGEIRVGDRLIDEVDPIVLRRSIGYVIQDVGLFPHWTVAANVGAVLRLQGLSQANWRAKTDQLLSLVDLDVDTFAHRYPEELSGGQQQRVGVARALAGDPHYLLMDEPFGALDGVTRESLQQVMLKLKQGLGKTIVFVTHDLFEALRLGDRIAVMHEGRLEQIGTPGDLLESPQTPFVKDLFAKPARQLAAYQQHLTD